MLLLLVPLLAAGVRGRGEEPPQLLVRRLQLGPRRRSLCLRLGLLGLTTLLLLLLALSLPLLLLVHHPPTISSFRADFFLCFCGSLGISRTMMLDLLRLLLLLLLPARPELLLAGLLLLLLLRVLGDRWRGGGGRRRRGILVLEQELFVADHCAQGALQVRHAPLRTQRLWEGREKEEKKKG